MLGNVDINVVAESVENHIDDIKTEDEWVSRDESIGYLSTGWAMSGIEVVRAKPEAAGQYQQAALLEHARRRQGYASQLKSYGRPARDGRSILHKEEASRGARLGQWLHGGNWSGARCVMEQADSSSRCVKL
jgi:hypothetical protein